MNKPPVDFSYIYELSGNDGRYIYEVISLFLNSIPDKLAEFEHVMAGPTDYAVIADQAHFLKSSSSVVLVRDMHQDMAKIELLARKNTGIDDIRALLKNVRLNFDEAIPVLIAERDKNAPGMNAQ